MIIPSRRYKSSLLLVGQSQWYLMVPLKGIHKTHLRMTNCRLQKLAYLGYWEGVLRVCFFFNPSNLHTLTTSYSSSSPPSCWPTILSKNFFYCPCTLKHYHLFFNSLEMFLRRAPRWLFPRGDRWIDIQIMTNEIQVHPKSFISTPSKHINIFSRES